MSAALIIIVVAVVTVLALTYETKKTFKNKPTTLKNKLSRRSEPTAMAYKCNSAAQGVANINMVTNGYEESQFDIPKIWEQQYGDNMAQCSYVTGASS
jgi:hypothetical protein